MKLVNKARCDFLEHLKTRAQLHVLKRFTKPVRERDICCQFSSYVIKYSLSTLGELPLSGRTIRLYWSKMRADIMRYIHSSRICTEQKPVQKVPADSWLLYLKSPRADR